MYSAKRLWQKLWKENQNITEKAKHATTKNCNLISYASSLGMFWSQWISRL